MSDETAPESLPTDAHTDAAAAFVDRARSRHGDRLHDVLASGLTLRESEALQELKQEVLHNA